MQLTDLLPLEKWVAFETELHARLGLDVNVFDPQGLRISDYKQWVNRLCPVIKADDRGQSFICAVAHMNIAGEAMRSRQPVLEACDAGLLKIVVPIFSGNIFLGAVGACGLLLEEEAVDTFLLNKTMEMDEGEAMLLAADIPVLSHAAALAHIRYIQTRLQMLLGAAGINVLNQVLNQSSEGE